MIPVKTFFDFIYNISLFVYTKRSEQKTDSGLFGDVRYPLKHLKLVNISSIHFFNLES